MRASGPTTRASRRRCSRPARAAVVAPDGNPLAASADGLSARGGEPGRAADGRFPYHPTVALDDTHSLLRAAHARAPDALPRLLERLRPRLVVWAAARMSPLLRSKLEPEDVAQEVLLAVHEDFASFRGQGDAAFFGWLFAVAKHRLSDLADHHGALKRRLPSPYSFTQTSPSDAAARREDVARIRGALEGLSDAHREVITLVRIEDLGVAGAAALLGRSPNAVRVLYCRALKALRVAMGTGGASA